MDWMNSLCHFFLLMIIDDFDVIRLAVAPDKTQPPLIVNADAVLAEPITLQRLQVIAGRYTQKIQGRGGMQLHQLSQYYRQLPDSTRRRLAGTIARRFS